jgi:TMEM175 potassium channel family protein
MSPEAEPPRARRKLDKGRMEGFSDGVFAFAITLLALDLAVHPPGTALHQLVRAWPSYVAYLISFLTIGGAWLGHMALTDQLTHVDAIFLRLNLLVLLWIAVLPFPTREMAGALREPNSERVFVTVYGLTLLTIRLFASALDAYARREHLYSPQRADEELRTDQRKSLPIIVGYAIAILIGLLLPQVAVGLYFALAVYLVVPFRQVRRLLTRSRRSREEPQ